MTSGGRTADRPPSLQPATRNGEAARPEIVPPSRHCTDIARTLSGAKGTLRQLAGVAGDSVRA